MIAQPFLEKSTSLEAQAVSEGGQNRSKRAVVSELCQQIRVMEAVGRKGGDSQGAISTGCLSLDDSLPEGGYVPGLLLNGWSHWQVVVVTILFSWLLAMR